MAYIRTKKVKGKEYQYLVEGYRDKDGKVKQRTIKYLGAVSSKLGGNEMVTTPTKKITFEEYLSYDDGTNKHYELVDGQLIEMPPASFLHSDIIDFIADCLRALATQYKLDIKVKTGDVGVRTGMNSSFLLLLVNKMHFLLLYGIFLSNSVNCLLFSTNDRHG
jgi:hypothetical protein